LPQITGDKIAGATNLAAWPGGRWGGGQGLSIQNKNQHTGRLCGRGWRCTSGRLRHNTGRRGSGAAAEASTAGARCDRRAAGNRNVLFPIQHECHGWTHLRQAGREVQHLLAGIGSIRQQARIYAGKHQISSGGERAALIEAGGQTAPPFRLCHGIPGDHDVAATLGSDGGY
jgi:hypothetical protein